MQFVLSLVLCCLVSPLALLGQSATEAPGPLVDIGTMKAPISGEWTEKATHRAFSFALSDVELTPEVWVEPDPSSDPQKSASNANNANNGNGSASAATGYIFPSKGAMTRHWVRSLVGPRAIIGSGIRASWNTWVSDSPKEWTEDASGWGKRFGVAAADHGMNQTSLFLLSMAMH